MKRIFLSIFALAAISTAAFAQSSPFEWQVGKDTKIKLGGYVRFNMNADYDGSAGIGNDFISSKITDAAWNEDESLNFDLTASRLSLQVTQSTENMGDVKLFVEADLRGSNVRLRQAYIETNGFIAGQAWSFMTDLAANAPTVDINGVGSRTFLRTPLFGYRHSFTDVLSGGISLEMPSLSTGYLKVSSDLEPADDSLDIDQVGDSDQVGDLDVEETTPSTPVYSDINQTIPNVSAYLQWKSSMGHIKAGVMLRALQYADNVEMVRESQIGLGGQLSGSLKASKAVTLYGQAIYGKGINNYISDLSSHSINMMSSDGATMVATPMGAASLGVSAKFAKKWSAAVSGSVSENFGDADYFDGSYQSSRFMALSLFYAPAPRVQLGAELLNGSRTNFGEDAIGAKRFSISAKYTL